MSDTRVSMVDRLERAAMAYERLGKTTRDDQKTRTLRRDAMAELAAARMALLVDIAPVAPEAVAAEKLARELEDCAVLYAKRWETVAETLKRAAKFIRSASPEAPTAVAPEAVALPTTGPFVDRIIRIFRDKPDDDTSAVVLQDYARAALSASPEAPKVPGGEMVEVARLQSVIERDRSKVAEAITAIEKAIEARAHLRHPGRGSYAWDDERYQEEFGHALDELIAALPPLKAVAKDWSDCPKTPEAIAAARVSLASREPAPVASGEGDVVDELAKVTKERDRLDKLVNLPETDDWMAGVPLEAAHQIERWGSDHDAGKTAWDWFWLIGYLSQKAATAQVAGDTAKAKHHTISTAGALLNWHRHLNGDSTVMRPGIDPFQRGIA